MNYFAYGSNMSQRRLGDRIDCGSPLGIYTLARHQLRFHKAGTDGSAKCDAFYTGGLADAIHGVLYRIDRAGKSVLDRIEGLGNGYEEKVVEVADGTGSIVEAITYYATHIDDSLLPFHWYKQHVLVGAQETGLPPHYVAHIENMAATDDPDPLRQAKQLSLY
jgi:gamma-glutamylcyclotransferase (GGCT)/AIG2-like uncharacterized protein YtfP